MKLLTKELLEKIPQLYATENEKDPTVWVKFFYPDAHWTWYGIEFDGEDIFFGYVVGHVPELGYFSLKELCETRAGTFHMPIERDISFTPCTLSALQRKVSD
jgi:hypothetical protein